MRIRYGTETTSIDVTSICFSRLKYSHRIVIPPTDDIRAAFFTDPVYGVQKHIFIEVNDQETVYGVDETIKIDVSNYNIVSISENGVLERLKNIHDTLEIRHGSFEEELQEQKMAARFLSGDEKVLEIGGNIGRNSLVISSILKNQANLVVLESDPCIARLLVENRDLNGLSFHVENAALSSRKLLQSGWDTRPAEVLEDGSFWVPTTTYAELMSKYGIRFDTLVLDCEGAFYHILKDFPEILEGIEWVIMENDYVDPEHKNYVDRVLSKNQFQVIYREGGGFWVKKFHSVWHCFFEVWRRC